MARLTSAKTLGYSSEVLNYQQVDIVQVPLEVQIY
jgi:hypothetical protein